MISKNELRIISGLKHHDSRVKTGKIFVEGEHLIREAAGSDFTIEYLIVSRERTARDTTLPPGFENYRVEEISDSDFKKLCDTKTPQGIGAIVRFPENSARKKKESGIVIFLDRIQDPGNVGTILRTARWFGCTEIITSEGTADIFNPKTVRSSMGASFYVHAVHCADSLHELNALMRSGYTIYGADMQGGNIFELARIPSKLVVVFGNEAEGIEGAIRNLITSYLSVPQYGSGESLNVASAASVILARLSQLKNS